LFDQKLIWVQGNAFVVDNALMSETHLVM